MEYRVITTHFNGKYVSFMTEKEARNYADKKAKRNKFPLIVLEKNKKPNAK